MKDNYPAIYPCEIAAALLGFGGCKLDFNPEEVTDALYQIKAIAENKLNSDYWRTLYHVLERVAEAYREQQHKEQRDREYFGHVRWCAADVCTALEDRGLPVTDENISAVVDVLKDRPGFEEAQITAGWDYIYAEIDNLELE